MDAQYLETCSEHFSEIVEDVKQRHLSRNNMPKLIVGTGLSIANGVPGMPELASYLNTEINSGCNVNIKEMWNKRYDSIRKKGLETGLINLTNEENILVDVIKPMTAKFILEREEALHKFILNKNTGFSKLLEYLSGTVSVNKSIIDIMTPNYDRIIEVICDKLGIGVITGFKGSLYCKFDEKLLRQATEFYNCRNQKWVRLFKPHGSLNWIRENDNVYLTNNFRILKEKAEFIDIVTPGGTKYKIGLTNNTFRCMREEFNELLRTEENYSLLIYGYGFNDDHFDTALFDCFQKNVLIISRDVKEEIIAKALAGRNITIFYHESDKEYMIYKSKKYQIDIPLWDIERFTDIFIG